MYVERIDYVWGYRSGQGNFACRYGVAKEHRELNNFYSATDVDALGAKLERIEIVRAEPPVFYATIVVLVDGEERKIDARPSDAIALAVRSNAPMFVEDDIMNRLGTVSTHAEDVDDEQEFEKFDEFVHTLSPDDF